MANRRIVYKNEVPWDLDILTSQKNMYVSIGQLIDTVLGNTTELNGFDCVPSTPPALTVDVEAGQIYSLETTDTTDYGSTPTTGIPADDRLLMKQGATIDAVTLSTPAPETVGFSVKYLVQIAFKEEDDEISERPFYQAVSQNVANSRSDLADVQIKAGVPATTGTEVAPTPDAGFTGAWVITVAYGQETVTSGDIEEYPNAPFIKEKLKDKISEATADDRYIKLPTLQTASYVFEGNAASTALSGTPVLLPLAQTEGPEVFITGNRIQPTFPCYLQINCNALIESDSAIEAELFGSFNAGIRISTGTYQFGAGGGIADLSLSGGVPFNGTTDYVEFYGKATGGTTTIEITFLSMVIIVN